MASGLLRRSLQLGFGVVSRKRNGFSINKSSHRKITSSVTCLQKYFSDKHEWLDIPDGTSEGTVGITDYAQDKLGDVVFVQLPEVGEMLEANAEVAVLESVKAASDLFSPISGEVTAVNNTVVDTPKLINDSPNEEGWLFKMKVADVDELKALMSEAEYMEFLKTEE